MRQCDSGSDVNWSQASASIARSGKPEILVSKFVVELGQDRKSFKRGCSKLMRGVSLPALAPATEFESKSKPTHSGLFMWIFDTGVDATFTMVSVFCKPKSSEVSDVK